MNEQDNKSIKTVMHHTKAFFFKKKKEKSFCNQYLNNLAAGC